LELGADPDHLSLWEWDQDEEFSGVDVVFPKGYSQITDGLANELDIRLATKVDSISYGANGVAVETSSGSFVADKAIVTFPLGVLKQAAVKFDPPLPVWKQSAIDRLDMGVLNKVYLKFPNVFWDETFEEISYVGERTGEWCDWLNFVPYIKEPVLMAFHGGAKGFAIEELSDTEIIAGAMKTLRVIYGDAIPEPDGFLITRWGKDPLSFGSYSHIPPFASGDDYDALFKPVDNVLYFAGEATSRKYPATVHGAYLSGVAAAGEIG
jgi:monoamine oxidase